MFELLADALKSLAAYPPVAAMASLVVIGGGVWLMVRGEKDRKSNGHAQVMPAWTMYGPVHEVMTSVHHISEQGRETNKILERAVVAIADIAKEQREITQLLEVIRNESRMR